MSDLLGRVAAPGAVVVHVHVDVDVLPRRVVTAVSARTEAGTEVSAPGEVFARVEAVAEPAATTERLALVMLVPAVAESASAPSPAGKRLRLVPAELPRDRLEASKRRRELVG